MKTSGFERGLHTIIAAITGVRPGLHVDKSAERTARAIMSQLEEARSMAQSDKQPPAGLPLKDSGLALISDEVR